MMLVDGQRPITKVDDTYAHPCGCVAEGKPTEITEACGRACPNFPSGLYPIGVKIRGGWNRRRTR